MKRPNLFHCLLLPFLSLPAYGQPTGFFQLSQEPSQPQLVFPISAPPLQRDPQPDGIASPAVPADSLPKPCADCIVISEAKQLALEEMQEVRGGFIDQTGLIYNFAVNVRTALNGAEVFTRTLTVSPALDKHLQATTATSLLTENIPKDLSVNIVGEGKGLSVANAEGGHALILNQTPKGLPISAVLNTLSNSDINQTISLTLKLNQIPPLINILSSSLGTALEQNTALHTLGLR